jgi:hypothetical protein
LRKARDGHHYLPDPKRPGKLLLDVHMSDFSLVPVDHQPDFSDVSFVPVDHDPFSAYGAIQQAHDQRAQTQTQPAQPQPENPPQQPATGVGQPNVGAPATGGSITGGSQEGGGLSPGGGNAGGGPDTEQGGSSEPTPFSGYANPTPTESLVNHAKMDDQEKLIAGERTGKKGNIIDGGELYKFVTTAPTYRYPIDGGTGMVLTATSPFYAYDGARYATIDASPERPVTVTIRCDGTFTISRP